MEKKINISEILKGCPSGMELDCLLIDDLVFDKVTCDNKIRCYTKKDLEDGRTYNPYYFYPDGRYLSDVNANCVIFPKSKTTWDGFEPSAVFKDGDIVATKEGRWIFIFESPTGETNNCHVAYEAKCDYISLKRGGWSFSRYATEEEKEKLFTAIKKNGYVWNAETKKLDKLEAPKKFDISTLKPFDKVLVRDSYSEEWNVDFFGYRRNDGTCRCMTFTRNQCIPFEGNEHLLGTANPCADFYDTWPHVCYV